MLGLAGLLILIAASGPGMSASRQNAAADAVVRYGLALGIDPDPEDAKADHPKPADAEAYDRAGIAAWFSRQIEDESDQIDEPPAAMQRYLSDHDAELWAVVAALEKGPPEWGELPEGERPTGLILSVRLTRILLAEALVADRGGDSIQAGRALEATWALMQPSDGQIKVLSQFAATAMEKLQAAVLRKLKDPPLSWQGRMSGNGPWSRMLEAIREETTPKDSTGALGPDSWDRPYLKMAVALNESLARVSPCELASRSVEDFEKSIEEVLSSDSSEEAREAAAIMASIRFPNLLEAARRAGRTEIDREMTLRVLELRLEKDSSVNHRWPDRLLAQTSDVCPGAEYAYRSDKAGIELRFVGTINPPTSVPVVPLVFRSRQPPPPAPTPTPATDPSTP